MEHFTLFYKHLKYNGNLPLIIDYVTTHEYNNLYCSIQKYKLCFKMFFSTIKEIPDNLIFFKHILNINYPLCSIKINILDYDYGFIDKYINNYVIPLSLKKCNKQFKLDFLLGYYDPRHYATSLDNLPRKRKFHFDDKKLIYRKHKQITFILLRYSNFVNNYIIRAYIKKCYTDDFVEVMISMKYIFKNTLILEDAFKYTIKESRNDFYDYIESTVSNDAFIILVQSLSINDINNLDIFDKLINKYYTYLNYSSYSLIEFLKKMDYDINILYKYYLFGFINPPTSYCGKWDKKLTISHLLKLFDNDPKYIKQIEFINDLNL